MEYTGIMAGVAIIGVGAFVLAAKHDSLLHRLFFLLAVLDGVSTILFGLATLVDDPRRRVYFWGTYWYHYIAFIALLALFGVFFPKPPVGRLRRQLLVGGIIGVSALALGLFALDHGLFWTPAPDQPIPATFLPLGNVVNMSFVLVVGVLVLRLTLAVTRERSESHRRQGAFVLGGMTLAYLPYPATVVAQDVAIRGATVFLDGRWDRVLAHWVYLGAFVAMLVAGARLMRGVVREARDERAFVLSCFGGVLALGAVGFALPDASAGILLRRIALLAYPVLLGWAIVRYEVFDIDRKLRRAATVTLTTVGLTVTFAIAESASEAALQRSLFVNVPAGWASGSAAALVTAGVFIPVTRASRKAASRIVPELSEDALHLRKLEIYRHSLAGALADGILREGESRTLAALRDSLGISDTEHKRMLGEVAPA